jgi:hypothetical protein
MQRSFCNNLNIANAAKFRFLTYIKHRISIKGSRALLLSLTLHGSSGSLGMLRSSIRDFWFGDAAFRQNP